MVACETDRLVAILLLLQQREHVTASEVALELEVSERTARRDLEALSTAGVPVYSMQGRGAVAGAWWAALAPDLSGLTAGEARALFLVAGPASTATPGVKAALRKLVRALPEPFREQAEAAATSVVVDPRLWGSSQPEPRPPRFLDELQEAVIRGVQVRLGYVDREGAETERTVHPLGIVAKGPTWYLVSDTEAGGRTFRIDRVSSVELTGDPVQRPEDSILPRVGARSPTRSTEGALPSRPRPPVRPTGSACFGWRSGPPRSRRLRARRPDRDRDPRP